jgi:3-isopropylmalate/(R)-2-methylmalate dehydratase small subunit
VPLQIEEIEQLFSRQRAAGGAYHLTVDLQAQSVTDGSGFNTAFPFDGFQRDMLLRGLDEIGRTLLEEDLITAYERGRDAGTGEREWR